MFDTLYNSIDLSLQNSCLSNKCVFVLTVSTQTLSEDVNYLRKGFKTVMAENTQQQTNFVLFISFMCYGIGCV